MNEDSEQEVVDSPLRSKRDRQDLNQSASSIVFSGQGSTQGSVQECHMLHHFPPTGKVQDSGKHHINSMKVLLKPLFILYFNLQYINIF